MRRVKSDKWWVAATTAVILTLAGNADGLAQAPPAAANATKGKTAPATVSTPVATAPSATALPASAGQGSESKTVSPEVRQALNIEPIRKGEVTYTMPSEEEMAKCSLTEENFPQLGRGLIVRDANGLMLRRFLDTNSDGKLDTWGYFLDGIEVYRDIDSDFNGRADQYRWYNTGGTRWAADQTENGSTLQWKRLSAEEASAEIVAAVATGDLPRFRRVLLTPDELAVFGLDEERQGRIAEQLRDALKQFQEFVSSGVVPASATWMQFAGGRPGTVPAAPGKDGKISEELTIYENSLTVFDGGAGSESKGGQIQLGTMIRVGEVWKTIAAPGSTATAGIFFQPPTPVTTGTAAGGGTAISDAMEAVHTEMSEIESALQKASAAQRTELLAKRESVYARLLTATKDPSERKMWLRQYTDLTAYAMQTGDDPDAAARLIRLRDSLAKGEDTEGIAYVQYAILSADYNARMTRSSENIDYAKVQAEWFASLEKFIADYPKSGKAAEAMFQLGSELELTGQEEQAKTWFTRAVTEFAGQSVAARSEGALRRLNAIGNPLAFTGRLLENGRQAINLEKLTGKVVLVCYWTTWNELSKETLAAARQLSAEYAPKGFIVVAVNLDHDPELAKKFLTDQKTPSSVTWYNVWEQGGLESPPALTLGIHQTPAMLLVDEKGIVYERPTSIENLTRDLKRMMR